MWICLLAIPCRVSAEAMPKPKILYCITKLELGGAQKHLLSLIGGLGREEFIPFLFTARRGELLDEALAIAGLTVRKSPFLERPLRPLKDALAFFELYRFIRRHNFDIVHTHSSKAGILGRLLVSAGAHPVPLAAGVLGAIAVGGWWRWRGMRL